MGKISKKLLKWRREQPHGAITPPETFQEIKREAISRGFSEKRAEKIAGSAYWKAAKKKFRKR